MERDRAVRIGNFSGFYGDRLSAMAEMLRGGPLDVLTGDYLAEVTMLVLAKSRLRRPGGGYASTFLQQLGPLAREIAESGTKVVVNAGGLDPASLAEAVRGVLASAGVVLSVAHVEGDDMLDRVPEVAAAGELRHLDTGALFSEWGREPLTANAYLGAYGIKAALDEGADVVVTGRVADASLVSGAAAWWWGWAPDQLDALAGAVIAGHVIECGAQATGGNFSGFKGIGLEGPGFPLAEIEGDGSAVITKHPGTAGRVSVGTVTAQLMYEVGSPAYLNPDVVALLDTVRLDQLGSDRVRIARARGLAPPPTTKVAITAIGGWHNSFTAVLTGLDVDEKARVFEQGVRQSLAGQVGVDEISFTRIGEPVSDAPEQMLGSCLLHVGLWGTEEGVGRNAASRLIELALANFPGVYFTGVPGNGAAYGAYWPSLVSQESVHQVVVLGDERRLRVDFQMPGPLPEHGGFAPAGEESHDLQATQASQAGKLEPLTPAPNTITHRDTRRCPLGLLVDARSGDKGGNANLGIWVRDEAAWPWLATTITTAALRLLLPEAADLEIERYEFPNLRAVNFVVKGLLGGGATEARRYDKQAKALGEWLRSRYFDVPVDLLPPEVA